MTAWIFQANPKRYDLLSHWSDGEIESWAANQHRKQMMPGDEIYFRLTGKEAGLYAVGTILSECYEAPNIFGRWKVDVRYERLISPPILRAETDAIAIAADYRPLIGREATNFPVPENIDAEIKKLIELRLM